MIADPVKTRRQWWTFDAAIHQEIATFSSVARRRLRAEGAAAALGYAAHGRPGALAAVTDKAWADYLTRVWMNTVETAGSHAGVVLGLGPQGGLFASVAAGYLKRNAAARGVLIADTSRKMIGNAIDAGERFGDTIERMKRRIVTAVENASGWRSVTIGSTEGHAAAGLGTFTAGCQTHGLVKVWAGPRAERVTCDQHKTVRGQRRPMRDPFSVLNDYDDAGAPDRLQYPGDGELGAQPANVINCRCYLDFERS